MDPVSAELKEIALMSVVTVRKRSFFEPNAAQESESQGIGTAVVDHDATMRVTTAAVEDVKPCPNKNLRIDSYDSSDDISGDSSTEQLSSPGILSPAITSLVAADDSCSTWPRKYRKASVRFTEDPRMVRQKESRSRLASASSTDWSDITDNGYIEDGGSSQKTSVSIEDDLVIPDWRTDNPVPVLGDESMSWKERERKLQDALDWLRNEIGEMKKQDQLLMCQFIQLRSDIHQLKFSGTKPNSRTGKSKISGSCSDLIKSPSYNTDPSKALAKFQSSMALNCQESVDEDVMIDDGDEDVEAERTLTEPEYLPEYRARTMSLLPPIQQRQQRRMNRMRTTRNKSFSAGTAENTDRGLTDLIE